MENGQLTKTKIELGSKAVTSEDSALSQNSVTMDESVSKSSPTPTTATTQNASKKTWKSAELQALRFKAGLVAGALAEFQGAKGVVVTSDALYRSPSGRVCKAIKVILVVEDMNLVAVETADGIDYLVAEPSDIVAE